MIFVKKLLTFLFVLTLLIVLLISSALADVNFKWNSTTSSVTIRDASFGLKGNSVGRKVFFVDSDSNAKITFEQSKGVSEYSPLGVFTGFGSNSTENAWGKYEIIATYQDGSYNVYQWDDTYFNSSCTIKLNKAGFYYIDIRPYTSDEMTASYQNDDFIRWSTPATWWISSKKNCTLSTNAPALLESSFMPGAVQGSAASMIPTTKYATVTVIHQLVDEGNELRRESKQLEPGSHTLYADYPVGDVADVYGSSSQRIVVDSDGVADTNTVVFQYKLRKKNTQSDPTQKPSSGQTGGTTPSFPIIGEHCSVKGDNSYVRRGPGKEYDLVATVHAGETFRIKNYTLGSTGKDWYWIDYHGQDAWISSGIVWLNGNGEGTIDGVPIVPESDGGYSSSPSNPGYQPPSGSTLWGFTKQRLSTRSGPGTQYTDTGTYSSLANSWVEVRSRAWDSRNDIWWVEVNVNGRWLWTGYKRFDSSSIPLETIPVKIY